MTHVAGTEPYAWPYDGRLDGPRIALVLAGWDDGWQTRATSGSDGPAATACARLARAVDGFGGTVVTVAHAPGSALLPPPVASAIALTAAGTDGFWGGPLEAVLRQQGLVRGDDILAALQEFDHDRPRGLQPAHQVRDDLDVLGDAQHGA